MKDAISKMVKKLSSDKSYGKTAGIFQYFVTFTKRKTKQKTKKLVCVQCIIDIGKLIENLEFNYASVS